ncbi:pectate lyase [Gilvimarinus agarilyticus]|uniref:pectate lyase n=1 Tax=unclassified Gilvimarinus TaxID=2642066 RepID=UPI001C0843F7|nr:MULTISPECIES: pectate lyase [unclassified Gilvimarinus]MBU2884228.1 pectate lyase [Gilvimarinus agarilyticus]MDO6569367.1 pectate lyase [Gilvimarinus sp. 2_MG-2023]MDO6747521.1 pectate lyase [Gilvimarinus sp. 1_MG-2023]
MIKLHLPGKFGLLTLLLVGCTSHEPVYRPVSTAGFEQNLALWQTRAQSPNAPKKRYAADNILAVADNLLLMQRNNGGWPSGQHPFRPISDAERLQYLKDQNAKDASFRHHNIFPQIFYLSNVYLQTGDVRYRNAARKALKLVLASQIYNGGWTAQAIRQTQTDDLTAVDLAVTLGALQFLRKIAAGEIPYGYIHFGMRKQAADAVRKGDELLLRLQQAYDSRLTLWASHYSVNNSRPIAGDNAVPLALNVPLSVRIVDYLMAVQRPPGEVVRSVQGALGWLEAHSLQRWLARQPAPQSVGQNSVERSPERGVWAKYYDIDTSAPLMDGAEGSANTRWFDPSSATGDWPYDLLKERAERWRQRVTHSSPVSSAKP